MINITKYGDLDIGDEVILNENDKHIPYIVIHKGLPSSLYDISCNGVWLLRKYLDQSNWGWFNSNREMTWWGDITYKNDYEKSSMHKKLNTDFLQRFNTEDLASIKDVKIPYRPGYVNKRINFGSNGLACKVFLLSGYEVGWTTSDDIEFPQDGAKLDYFIAGNEDKARERRIALTKSNEAFWWWLRSPYLYTTHETWLVREDGLHRPSNSNGVTGIRPCIIVHPDRACLTIDYI